ncbi:MAG: alpha/beta hydrolase [Clostridiales Family XIII bacterium]|nr:alpha/beta hydrolase [Clostridiales Family XIII bacterium]
MRSDGTKLRICVYSPLVPKENVPGVLWIHGGGYSIGIPEQDDHYIRRFVETYGCVVVSPDYMLSLDKPYPAAMDDCYAALIWLSDHGEEYGMRSDQIFVGGNSAGGGLAAAVCLYARDQGVPAIAYQMLLYPMLDDRPTESSTDNDAPVWDSKLNLASWRLYLGDVYGTDDVSIYAAPARATDLTNLPATFSFVGSIEPFFNETVQYIERLENAGIPVHFKVFDGCFHGFDQICYKTDISRKAAIFMKENFDYAVRNYFAEQHK